MKRQLTALISALAIAASTMTAFVTVNAEGGSNDLNVILSDYASTFLADGNHPSFKWEDNQIKNKEAVKVDADMKAKKSDVSAWKDKVDDNKYSAGTTLNKSYEVDYKTELNMAKVFTEYTEVTTLAKNVISAECAADTDGGARKAELLEQLEKSYIENASFDIQVKIPDGMTVPNSMLNGRDMYGFTAVKGDEVITPADGKLIIPSSPAPGENNVLTYTEVSRQKSGDTLTIKIATEGKTSHKALAEALQYNLVLTCENITAKGPSGYNSTKTMEMVGTVTGETPIYVSDAAPIALIDYEAVQDTSSSDLYDSGKSDRIAAAVRITTDRRTTGGGGYVPPVVTPTSTPTPTPTLTPTAKPDELISVPKEFNADDHMAYIIGYPEGDVRPENNISREEVATIFYRLLTDETRANLFTHDNDYSDVAAERWSNNAISTLSKGGYITGYEDGTFKPAAYITRAEFVTIASRFYADVVAASSSFSDTTGHWAEKNIDKGVFYRLIDGYEDGTFKPNQLIKRNEAMKIVNTILNRHVTVEGLTDEAVANNWIDNPENAWYYTEVLEATTTHDFTRPEGTLDETWTQMRANPDWEAIEKTWTETGNEHNN